jgi:hypothetical protein
MAEAVALPIKYDREGRSAAIMKLIGYNPFRENRTAIWINLLTRFLDRELAFASWLGNGQNYACGSDTQICFTGRTTAYGNIHSATTCRVYC